MPTEQAADSQEMGNALEERFRSNDVELLKTGQYSDAQVIAGGRTWSVHKSIVCLRSGYMRDVVFAPSAVGKSEPVELPFDTTGLRAYLLFEFLYSGSIAGIDDLPLTVCVWLSVLGQNFRVDGMVHYATNKLWAKLNAILPPISIMPAARDQPTYPCDSFNDCDMFGLEFMAVVEEAYSSSENACQLLLADFVWAARSQLLGAWFIEDLNLKQPRFGNHILTTLNKGPQSPFLKLDGNVTSTFCTKCAQEQVDTSAQQKLFRPDNP